MKVIKRQQVTQIVTSRQVSHTLKVGDKTYTRYEMVVITMPYMDCTPIVGVPKIKWTVKVSENTSQDLSAKEVKQLQLNEQFSKLDIDSKNGNN